MAPMKKCSTTRAHCRKVGSKQKAKLPCTVNGARGTVVKMPVEYSRDKNVLDAIAIYDPMLFLPLGLAHAK